MTHGQARRGAGGTLAGSETQIGGNITLPAGGPWTIFGVWMQAVRATLTFAEAVAGSLIVKTVSGDITPQPAPAVFPIDCGGSSLGSIGDVQSSPLTIFPVNWQGAGKAVLSLNFLNHLGNAVAPQIATGILFGSTIPTVQPLMFSDVVRGAITTVAETQIGTITLAEKAKRIVGIKGLLVQDGVLVTAEELIGTFRLASADVLLTPGQYPFSSVSGAGVGATIGGSQAFNIPYIPIDMPVIGGSFIDCFVSLNTLVTNAASAQIAIAYE